jgi:SpoIID/LytB domain protein
MPSDWPAAALQAQVVAARTYALRQAIRWGAEPNLDSGRRAACWCQLYGSVVDQNYVGYSKETAQYGANWVAAVDATAGRLISHPLAADLTVIIGYYSSSSGGMTESNVTGLGQTTLLPYLQSVNDPWSLDPFNPFANWTDPVTPTDAASGLGLDSVTTMQITAWNPSGSVASVQVAGTLGGTVQSLTKTGRQIKSALGLRSSWFSVSAAETFFPPFKDDEGSVHEADIVSIWERSITQGCAADLYCPAETVTRWQMALFLTRLQTAAGFAIPPPAAQGFADIGLLPQAYQDAINQLKVMGITQGTSATTYAPDAVVTRWQMALFLTRLMSMDGLPLPDGSSQGYADIGHLSADSQRAVNQLRQLGVTVTDGAFEPDLKLPRDQMASFLARTLLRVDPL